MKLAARGSFVLFDFIRRTKFIKRIKKAESVPKKNGRDLKKVVLDNRKEEGKGGRRYEKKSKNNVWEGKQSGANVTIAGEMWGRSDVRPPGKSRWFDQ